MVCVVKVLSPILIQLHSITKVTDFNDQVLTQHDVVKIYVPVNY